MNKNKPAKKLGFSLIELSVVILIIGILVIGVVKGKKILDSARLASARSLTKGSPVNFNSENLAFWLETTSEKSFDAAEAVNNALISTWHDIKLSATSDRFDLTQSTPVNQPEYITNATNGLPAVRFGPGSKYMIRNNVLGSDLTQEGNQITIFVVQKYTEGQKFASILHWQNNANGTNRIGLTGLYTNSLYGTVYFDFGTCCANNARLAFNPVNFVNRTNVISVVRRPNYTAAIRVNGTRYISGTGMNSDVIASPSATLSVCNSQLADMNEIIIFKTALTDNEIKDIEKYLSDKWGVPLTGL